MTTNAQQITPELRRWVIDQAEAGCRPQDVVQAMIQSGWKKEVALKAMDKALREHLKQMGPEEDDLPPPVAVPDPDRKSVV